jgi:hypothetical protein
MNLEMFFGIKVAALKQPSTIGGSNIMQTIYTARYDDKKPGDTRI